MLRKLVVVCVLACWACAESRPEPSGLQGGETHFLACESSEECQQALGPGHSCADGVCVSDASGHAVPTSGPAMRTDNPSPEGSVAGASDPMPAAGVVPEVSVAAPLLTLLVDTSGSQERLPDCQCQTPACRECLPDCSVSERNRWAHTVEALTGSFEDFGCQALERTEDNGMTYDVGYYAPHHRITATSQLADGILDTYKERVRFGLATFDSWDTYVGAPPLVTVEEYDQAESESAKGLWSYDPNQLIVTGGFPHGTFYYPNCVTPYRMDTGVRGPQASEGALQLALDRDSAGDVNAQVQASLLRTRPYGGTPVAASLDDLYYYLLLDPATAGLRETPPTAHHVVLLTDGYPDEDYRDFDCDCAQTGDPTDPDYWKRCDPGPESVCTSDPASCPNHPSVMRCPYPTVDDAAAQLASVTDGVHVIGLAIDVEAVANRLDEIAAAGGTEAARFVSDAAGIRSAVDEILAPLLTEP